MAKKISSLYIITVSALLAVILSDQLSLSIIFYGNYIMDWIISGIVVVASFWLVHKYWKPSVTLVHWLQWAFVPLALFGRQLEYTLYSYSEAVSLISYLILIIGVVAVINSAFISSNEVNRDSSFYGLVFIAFVPAFIAGYLFHEQNWILVIGLLAVACQVYFLWDKKSIKFALIHTILIPALTIGYLFINPPEVFASQKKFHDKVIFSETTPFQRIDVTSWKGEYWFYYNGINQFSSIDEWLYYEPMVHPAMLMAEQCASVLVVGGENGLVSRELLKYADVTNIHILPMDSALFRLASKNELFTRLNKGANDNPKVHFHPERPFQFLARNEKAFDVIIIDIPDPIDLEINQYFTKEFYELCSGALTDRGTLVTQAGSPYFATKAFYSIDKTLQAANFATVPIHNQVLSLGEWGWILAAKNQSVDQMKLRLERLDFALVNTKWLNAESMAMMQSFGKPQAALDGMEINSMKHPVVHHFYTTGTWNF